MSVFLDVCRFTPTTGGTTDWTFASAVTGYQSPSAAGIINGSTYSYRAESSTLVDWEMGVGTYNTGTGVLTRTTVLYNSLGTGTGSGQSGAGTKINFGATPQVAVVCLNEDLFNLHANSVLLGGSSAYTITLDSPATNKFEIKASSSNVLDYNTTNSGAWTFVGDIYNGGTAPTGTGAYVRGTSPSFNFATGVGNGIVFTSANTGFTNQIQVDNSGTIGTAGTTSQLFMTLNGTNTYAIFSAQGGASPAALFQTGAGMTGGFQIASGAGVLTLTSASGLGGVVTKGPASSAFSLDIIAPSATQNTYLRMGSNNTTQVEMQTDSAGNWSVNQAGVANTVLVVNRTSAVSSTLVLNAGNVGINKTPATMLDVNGPIATKVATTVTGTTYTVLATDSGVVGNNTTATITLTLPAGSSFPGRWLYVTTITAHAITSASSNVLLRNSTTPGVTLLTATAGAWALLQSDGTNWRVMAGT